MRFSWQWLQNRKMRERERERILLLEGRGRTFLRNVDNDLRDYMESHPQIY
jgi:hypothetical protein